jgi:hypothetical protein
MSLSRVKVWNTGDVLTASDLNGEFNNILVNASTLVTGLVPLAATQLDQETSTSLTTFVSPGRQQLHPSAAKVWCVWANTSSIQASYGVASITDNGTGDWTVNFTTVFSSNLFCVHYTTFDTGAGGVTDGVAAVLVGSAEFKLRNAAGALTDGTSQNYMVAFGDQ